MGGMVAGFLLPVVGIPVIIGLSAMLVGVSGLFGYQVWDLRMGGAALSIDDFPHTRQV